MGFSYGFPIWFGVAPSSTFSMRGRSALLHGLSQGKGSSCEKCPWGANATVAWKPLETAGHGKKTTIEPW